MADKNAHFCASMLNYYGFSVRTDVTAEFAGISGSDIGRADMFAARMGKAVHVEIKRGVETFNLEDWRINQRQWGAWTSAEPFCIPYYLFLTLGKHPANYNPRSYMPKKTWLVPLHAMLDVAAKVQAVQKSIVYRVKPKMKKALQQGQLDAVTLLKPYELTWVSNTEITRPAWMSDPGSPYGGFWIVPETHEFYQRYIDAAAKDKLFFPTEEELAKIKALVPAYVSKRETKAKEPEAISTRVAVKKSPKAPARRPARKSFGRRWPVKK